MNDLKSCPFCNNTEVKIEHNIDGWAYIGCSNCGCRGPESRLDHLAVTEWNERTSMIDKQIDTIRVKLNDTMIALHNDHGNHYAEEIKYMYLTTAFDILDQLTTKNELESSKEIKHQSTCALETSDWNTETVCNCNVKKLSKDV